MSLRSPLSAPPRFGAAAIVLNGDGKLLVGQRFGSHGAGSWQLPGGHVEDGEGLLRCAARETAEETGLDVDASRVVATTYDVFAREAKHYVTFFVLCGPRHADAVPEAREPRKCPQWLWKTAEELQRLGMFLPLRSLFRQKPDLDRLLSGTAPVVQLPDSGTGRRAVTVHWNAEPAACGLRGHVLGVGPGGDLAIVGARPANADCGLGIVVMDPDDRDKTLTWPLGSDVLVLPPPESPGDGPRASLSLKRLCMAQS